MKRTSLCETYKLASIERKGARTRMTHEELIKKHGNAVSRGILRCCCRANACK